MVQKVCKEGNKLQQIQNSEHLSPSPPPSPSPSSSLSPGPRSSGSPCVPAGIGEDKSQSKVTGSKPIILNKSHLSANQLFSKIKSIVGILKSSTFRKEKKMKRKKSRMDMLAQQILAMQEELEEVTGPRGKHLASI